MSSTAGILGTQELMRLLRLSNQQQVAIQPQHETYAHASYFEPTRQNHPAVTFELNRRCQSRIWKTSTICPRSASRHEVYEAPLLRVINRLVGQLLNFFLKRAQIYPSIT